MDVEALVQAGAILEFRLFEEGRLLSYEPVTGNLVLRNGGREALEYKASLLKGSSIVMKVFQPDGSEVEVSFRNAPVSRSRRAVLVTLAPGEEHTQLLVFGTAGSVLEVPGVYRTAFALTENGYLQTSEFQVTVTEPEGVDLSLLEAMRNLNPSLINPVLLTEHLEADPSRDYMEQIAEIVQAHPTSRYAASLAKDLADYMAVTGTYGDANLQQFLGMAATYGSTVVSEPASSNLNRLMDAQGEYVVSAGEISEMMAVIQEYYEALASSDAARLSVATGLNAQSAARLLDEFQQELTGEGVDALVAVNLPPVSPQNLVVQAVGVEEGLYSVRVNNIEFVVESGGAVETHITHTVLHLSHNPDGSWVVVKQ